MLASCNRCTLVLVFFASPGFLLHPFFSKNGKRGERIHRLSASSKGRPAAFIKLLADLRFGGQSGWKSPGPQRDPAPDASYKWI